MRSGLGVALVAIAAAQSTPFSRQCPNPAPNNTVFPCELMGSGDGTLPLDGNPIDATLIVNRWQLSLSARIGTFALPIGVACPLNVTMRSRGVYEVRSNLDVEVFTQKYFRPNLCAVVIVNRTGSGRTIFDLGAWIINSNRSLDCPQAADLADPTAAGLDFVSVNTFNPATCAASSAPALGLASGQWWLTLGMAAVATLLSWTWAA